MSFTLRVGVPFAAIVAVSTAAQASFIQLVDDHREVFAKATTAGDPVGQTTGPAQPAFGSAFDELVTAQAVGNGAAAVTARQESWITSGDIYVNSSVAPSASAIPPGSAHAEGRSIFDVTFDLAQALEIDLVATASGLPDTSAIDIRLLSVSGGTTLYDWSADGAFYDATLTAGRYRLVASIDGFYDAPSGDHRFGGLIVRASVPAPAGLGLLAGAGLIAARRRR